MGFVLVRGMKQDARHWLDLPDRLADAAGVPVVTLDLPGVGAARDVDPPRSVRGLTRGLREQLRAKAPADTRWVGVGLSLAGMAMVRWAVEAPDELAGVVLGNSSAAGLSAPWQRLRWTAWPQMVRTVFTRELSERERRSLGMVSNAPAERLDALAHRYARFAEEQPYTRRTFVRQLAAGATFRMPARVEVPTLVLCGGGDRFVSPRCSEALASRLGAPLHRHPTAGHDLAVDAPEWLISELLRFGEDVGVVRR